MSVIERHYVVLLSTVKDKAAVILSYLLLISFPSAMSQCAFTTERLAPTENASDVAGNQTNSLLVANPVHLPSHHYTEQIDSYGTSATTAGRCQNALSRFGWDFFVPCFRVALLYVAVLKTPSFPVL